MLSLGLLGKGISHSKSPEMYRKIYNCEIDYHFFDYEIESSIPNLETIFKTVSGLSITAPYKKHFLGDVKLAEDIIPLNAINCIAYRSGDFYGTNTDYLALAEIFESNEYDKKNIILLGSGSMAHITECYLNSKNINFKNYNRKNDGDLSQLDFSDDNLLVINACGRSFDYRGRINSSTVFWDYNYSHEFHLESLQGRCEYIDGADLLYRQAVHATKFWNF